MLSSLKRKNLRTCSFVTIIQNCINLLLRNFQQNMDYAVGGDGVSEKQPKKAYMLHVYVQLQCVSLCFVPLERGPFTALSMIC